MARGQSKLFWTLIIGLVAVYLLSFTGFSTLYIFSAAKNIFASEGFPVRRVLGWFTVGLSLSVLASLGAWPFALSIATLIEHNRAKKITHHFLRLATYLANFPLVLFIYAYIEVIGFKGFLAIKSVWLFLFATPNFFTQSVAFALTILLYPLTVIPGVSGQLSIQNFYQDILTAVMEFGEVGLVASVVGVGLFLYVLPKMVLHMRKRLQDDENTRSFEIIKSMGGTPWESMQLTVMQSMKTQFNSIILKFTKICFFEGLITYSLLNAFFFESGELENHWSSSLSSVFLKFSMGSAETKEPLLALAGFLSLSYLVFKMVEHYQESRFRGELV